MHKNKRRKVNHAINFQNMIPMLQDVRNAIDVNHTHVFVLPEKEYTALPKQFRAHVTTRKSNYYMWYYYF